MMTVNTRITWNKAKDDLVFRESLKNAGEKMYKPKWNWGDLEKSIYSAIYMGYLVAKGYTKEQIYKN